MGVRKSEQTFPMISQSVTMTTSKTTPTSRTQQQPAAVITWCKQVAMDVPPFRVEDYIPRSVLDKIFFGYYVFQIISTLGLDMQGTFPAFLYPSWVKVFYTHHLETWRDPWLANTWEHPWYFSICMWEYFLHIPFYFVAAYVYYNRITETDRCPWIRTPVILYCTQTITAVSSVVMMALMGDFTHATALAPSGLFQRLKLAGMYGTFFCFCLLNLLDALTGRDYLPQTQTPAPTAAAAAGSGGGAGARRNLHQE